MDVSVSLARRFLLSKCGPGSYFSASSLMMVEPHPWVSKKLREVVDLSKLHPFLLIVIYHILDPGVPAQTRAIL